jgi:hypothetical protein
MEMINIKSTEDTPGVVMDKGKSLFEISGRSLPEDAAGFFKPLITWLQEYAKSPNATTHFIVKLEYFNTASSKMILDILSKLESISNTKVVWFYHEDDEDMQEAGQEFSEMVEVPFEFKTY